MLVSAGTMAVLFVFSGNDQRKDQEIAKGQEEIQVEIQAEKPPVEETKEDKEQLPKKAVVKRTTETKEKIMENTASNTENAVLEAELEDQYLEAEEFAEVSAADVIAEGFQENPLLTLNWPVEGEVILPFSIDLSVYFATLAQYQYNPAMIIGAEEGTEVLSAAKGTVIEVAKSNEYGHYIVVDLGDGYELTYGQLGNIELKERDYMQAGDVVGTVATPTKYFTEEGTNVYFKLTHNGEPCDPLNRMS